LDDKKIGRTNEARLKEGRGVSVASRGRSRMSNDRLDGWTDEADHLDDAQQADEGQRRKKEIEMIGVCGDFGVCLPLNSVVRLVRMTKRRLSLSLSLSLCL
jgi:hypothetical protein